MKKLCFTAILSLMLSPCLFAQITGVTLLTKAPALYEKTEWDIHLVEHWKNPYLQEEVALDMDVTAPSGKKLVVPCYYVSGSSGAPSLWKARFTPQETGRYSCRFILSRSGKTAATSQMHTFRVKTSAEHGFLHAAGDWIFRYDDGTPFRGIGENIGWESRTHDDNKYLHHLNEDPKYNYGYLLPALQKHGGNFFRTWICRWNLPIDWKDGFNNSRYDTSSKYYNPSALRRMDWMVALADSLHLHMMLTLGPGAFSVRDGGLDSSAAEFFVDSASRVRYKDRLRYIIARWGYSPAIGAWELFNEVDNVMYRNPRHPIDAASIVRWHDEMSAYIKKTDPYGHLVTTSISHRDLPGLDTLHAIDFNQKHIYKNTTSIPSTIKAYEKRFHKPYVIGEFAYEWDWTKNFNLIQKGLVNDFKRGLWYGLFSPTPILPMSWWWEYFNSLGTDAYIARVRDILDQMLAAGKGSFETIKLDVSSPALTCMAVQCGRQLFVYAYNPTDSSVASRVTWEMKNKAGQATVYDCETGKQGKSENVGSKDGKAVLPVTLPPNADNVFIIKR